MPEGYLKIKAKFKKKGMSEKEAAEKAARIWNATHKGKQTVGRGRK